LKILILTPNYPNKNAPMNGVFIHQQVKALTSLGHECYVLLPYNWFPKFNFHKYHPYWREGFNYFSNLYDFYEGIRIHPVPVFIKMPNRLFREDPYQREANALASYIQNRPALHSADLICAHFMTETAYVGVLLKKKLEKPLVSFARGDDIHAWPKERPALLEHVVSVFQNSDLLVANSLKLGEDAKKIVSEKVKKDIKVVYNGIDFHKFFPVDPTAKKSIQQTFRLQPELKYLLCVATPVALKGWLELFDAIQFNSDNFENWKLLCVTVKRDYPDKLDLKKEADKRGILQLVKFFGQLPHAELSKLYQAVDAFVLPSYNEGMANVVLEAAASNLPLLITDVGGHREIFGDSESCIFVSPVDSISMSEGLSKFLNLHNHHPSPADTRAIVISKVGSYLDNARKLTELIEDGISK
jgi:glycosyltransferase involved in cell wall biosynthesis